jgi:hypothetical protein
MGRHRGVMPAMLQPASRFYLIGITIAGLEEFITQGVLKNNLGGWIIPTIIAFLPFLIIVRSIGQWLNRRMNEHTSALIYYLVAGGIGLAVEWFLIGLSPWSNPHAQPLVMLVLQLGMFSFWSSVAFTPRLLLDKRDFVFGVRRRFKRFLILGMAAIYGVTFAVSKEARFPAGIASVLIVFISMNFYYLQHFRALKGVTK